jgi:tetratricopeptide (TPR) repeat protein
MKNSMKHILVVMLLATSAFSNACVNEYNTLLNGEIIFTDPAQGRFWGEEVDRAKLTEIANWHLSSYKASGDLQQYSDYAAQLIYLGKYQKAKKIYEEIEILKPNLYTTASNLGTIYELLGKSDSALLWIKRSIELNPESHFGSEWIHLKILEYQINGSKEDESSILGLDFGNANIPANPRNYDLREIRNHITHQLRERTRFVKPKNYTVGNIYFDYGNIIAQTRDIESALQSYDASSEYGFESPLLRSRISELKRISLFKKTKVYYKEPEQFFRDNRELIAENIMLILVLGVIGFILFVIVFMKLTKRILGKLRNH